MKTRPDPKYDWAEKKIKRAGRRPSQTKYDWAEKKIKRAGRRPSQTKYD